MAPLVLIIGFACLGGLMAGYTVARLCPRRALWLLWSLCAVCVAVTAVVRARQDVTAGLDNGLLLFAMALPFAICAFLAGLIGLVARRVLGTAE